MRPRPDTLRQQAAGWLARGDWPRAIAVYRQLLNASPEGADDWYNLAYALRQAAEYTAALEAYQQALDRGVVQPEEVHLNRAVILADELYRETDAEQELRRALELNPGYAPALLNLGNLLEETGRQDDALDCYRRLQAPGRANERIRFEALSRLAHLDAPTEPDDPRLEELQRSADTPGIDAGLRANLLLALARSYDRLGLHERAFAAMTVGKRAAAQTIGRYRPERQERIVDTLMAQFQSPPDADRPAPPDAPRPVFVCGMYRSGSTLVEQVLSAHPDVLTGGELDLLPRLVARHLPTFPVVGDSLDEATAGRMAAEYLDEVRARLPGLNAAAAFTDKHPPNFLLIGLICRVFPLAHVVHTCRNPLDTVLSIYMQHLDTRLTPYANDLADIADYYIQYHRLMSHWHQAFPGRIHDVSYDRLVAAPEDELRPLLDDLGLDWDPTCLEFHRSRAPVRTASYWQVRQPLYKNASGRWKHYREALDGVRRQLAEAGLGPAD